MIALSPATRIYLATGATDLRKSFEGLSDLVAHRFQEDPLSGHLYVFTNRKKNRTAVEPGSAPNAWVKVALPGPRQPNPQRCASWPRN